MSLHKFRRIAFLAVAACGCCFFGEKPVFAGGYPVWVDPNCDQNCQPTCCQRFCRTLKLHCVYFKRSCTQKYILVPTSQGCPTSEFVPDDCPTYSRPYAYPTINGYGDPPVNSAPPGVFIR